MGACGFQQQFGLPCPGCYITRSAGAFVHGRLLDSLYLQPAGFVMCVFMAVIGVFSLLAALTGVDFIFLRKIRSGRGIIVTLIAAAGVFLIGWAATLIRVMAAN